MFLRMLLPVLSAFFVVWQASVYFDVALDRRQRFNTADEAIRRGREVFDATLKTYTEDLKILSKGQNLRSLAGGNRSVLDAVARDFVTFATEKPVLAQLRYIDRNGQEIVQIDRQGATVIQDGTDALQNEADRYYFIQSIGLPQGEIYFSPIDLNVEHGKPQVPWNPTARLATPVPGIDGKTAGIVIINIDANQLIAAAERETPAGSAPIQLLNGDGYWLAGVNKDQLWGFIFNRPTTMARSAPETWQHIVASRQGSFDKAGAHYVFETLQPGRPSASGKGLGNGIQWVFLAVVPPVSLRDLWEREHFAAAVVGLLITALVCLGWTRTALERQSADATWKAAQEELIRADRMASLGSLVAGVAHELNTPIGNAVVLASTLADRAENLDVAVAADSIKRSVLHAFAEDIREGTRLMLRSLERTAELLGHFKQVAIDQTREHRRVFRLDDLVSDVVSSLQPQFKHGGVDLALANGSKSELNSYPGPLVQVLLNLIINARSHGFEGDQKGQVLVTTRDLPSEQVEITVCDNGKGIPHELQRRIFEPFFTTSLGKGGSGLGLSIVSKIVTDVLGGTIRVDSKPLTGTCMIVCIPRSVRAKTADQLGKTHDAEHRTET
ncbi:MAG: sensor histidine kinase [Rhodanobacteraceae bacterium]